MYVLIAPYSVCGCVQNPLGNVYVIIAPYYVCGCVQNPLGNVYVLIAPYYVCGCVQNPLGNEYVIIALFINKDSTQGRLNRLDFLTCHAALCHDVPQCNRHCIVQLLIPSYIDFYHTCDKLLSRIKR